MEWVGPTHTAVLQATELLVWSGWVLRIQQYCRPLSCWCGVGESYAYSSTAGRCAVGVEWVGGSNAYSSTAGR